MAAVPVEPGDAVDWAALAVGYEREARARGPGGEAAALLFQAGRIYDEELGDRDAALECYRAAFAEDPGLVPNLQSARRVAIERGDAGLAVELLEAEERASRDPAERAQLAYLRGRLLDERLGRGAEARQLWLAAASLDPKNLALAEQVAALAAAEGRHEDLAIAYERCAEAVEDPRLRAHYLAAAAAVYEEALGQVAAAADAALRAFRLAPDDPVVRSGARRHAEGQGREEELAEILRAEGRGLAGSSPREAAAALLALARLLADRLGRPDEALAALAEAGRLAPDDPGVLVERCRLQRERGDSVALVDALRARAQALAALDGASDEQLIEAQLELAQACEERLGDPQSAAAGYLEVLRRDPRHRVALAALGRLRAREGDWEAVLETFLAEREAAPDREEKAEKCFRAGEILERQLGRFADAVREQEEAVRLAPGFLPARQALERLYERTGRWSELAELLEQEVSWPGDRQERAALLFRVARLREERLDDAEAAVRAYERILELSPEHAVALRALASLHQRAGSWQALVEVNARQARLAREPRHVVALLQANGDILAEQLGDDQAAAETYRAALRVDPSYLPALAALGRLHARAGRWEEIAALYREQAERAPAADAAAGLYHRAAEILERRLGLEEQAIAAYREVLTLAPSHAGALQALARLYRARQEWENLVEILRAQAASRGAPAEKAEALLEAAAVWEERLANPRQAVEALEEALRLMPAFGPALRALDRLYPVVERWTDLLALRRLEAERASGAEGAAILLRYARLAFDRFGDRDAAAAACEQSRALDPANPGALLLEARLRSAASDARGLAAARASLAAGSADRRAAAALLFAAACDRQLAGDDPGAELNRAAELHAADGLGDAWPRSRAGLDRPAVARRYQARAEGAEGSARVHWAACAGDAWERSGEPERALAAYQAALAVEPAYLPALRGTRRIFAARGDWAAVRATLQVEGSALRDPAGALAAWVAAGEIAASRFADPGSAAGDYLEALKRDPLDAGAFAKLQELPPAPERESALCHAREARARARADPVAAAEEWVAAARIAAGDLGDRSRALAELDRALELAPELGPAREMRGVLLGAAGRHAEAARDLEACVASRPGSPEALPLHLSLADLYLDPLGDPTRAAFHLNHVLAASPQNGEALGRLARLHREVGNWPVAAEALRRLSELTEADAEARAGHLIALSELEDEGLGDAAAAAASCRRALDLVPGHPEALARLEALHRKSGDLAGLAATLEGVATSAPDAAVRLDAHLRAAAIHAGPLRRPDRAIAELKEALALDPACADARAMLARLHAEGGQPVEAVAQHRALIALDPFRLESWRGLFELFAQTGARDRAFFAAAVLHWLRDDHGGAAAAYGRDGKHAPGASRERLGREDWDLLRHPGEVGPLSDLLEAAGDALAEAAAEGRPRLERLRADHPLRRLFEELAANLGAEEYELFLAEGADVRAIAGRPPAVAVGADLARHHRLPEQRFLLGRVAAMVRARSFLALALDAGALGEALAAAVRQVAPGYTGTGRPGESLQRRVAKALSRRERKALEAAGAAVAGLRGRPDVGAWRTALGATADRAGLLVCGDPTAAFGLVLRGDSPTALHFEGPQHIRAAAAGSPRLAALLTFAASEEHFALRQKLKLAVEPA